jgi:hypothetical protein
VGIRVVDHVIVAEAGYYSFRESEAGFEERPAPFHVGARDIQR